MQSKIRAINPSGDEEDVKSTVGGAVYSADLARIWTAKGYGWQAMATTAVASLIVRPAELSIFTFYNNTAKNFVVERVFTHNLISIVDGNFSIWICVHPIGMTIPGDNDITIRNNLNGNYTAGTEGVFDIEEAVTDDGWYPWGPFATTIDVTVPGTVQEAKINGRIVLPPKAGISVSAVAQTAVVTQCMGLTYYSVPKTEYTLA